MFGLLLDSLWSRDGPRTRNGNVVLLAELRIPNRNSNFHNSVYNSATPPFKELNSNGYLSYYHNFCLYLWLINPKYPTALCWHIIGYFNTTHIFICWVLCCPERGRTFTLWVKVRWTAIILQDILVRGQNSNLRPSGYEPPMLPLHHPALYFIISTHLR